MKILYVAPAEVIPGTVGGSIHVEEVARGLGELGYSVDVLSRVKPGYPQFEEFTSSVRIHRLVPRYRIPYLLWHAKKYAQYLASIIKPDYIIERYYNFGGAGILTARKLGIPIMLEVNSPVIDHPGSLKSIIDRLLIFRPMKKYREFLCRNSSDIITPLPSIIPSSIPGSKIHRVNWGANIGKFDLKLEKESLRKDLGLPQKKKIIVFTGSFRKWHGIWEVTAAVKLLQEKTVFNELCFLMIGDGEEKKPLERWISGNNLKDKFILTGAVAYEKIPQCLLASDIGIAPYDPSRHSQLQLGFYWSPLKIFEYMSARLPVITIDIEPLNSIIRNNKEGITYSAGDKNALAEAIANLAQAQPEKLKKLGDNGFSSIKDNYSWSIHCRELDKIIKKRLGIK